MQSGRVRLRRVEPADYPLVQQWQNDPVVFRWMDYERPFTLEDVRRNEDDAAGSGHPFIIEAEGKPVGRIGLNNLRARDRVASMYLFLGDRDSWGRGYARDALVALLSYAFDHLNLRQVELWTLGDNERAIRLYKSVGFVAEARLRNRSFKEGHYIDHVVMSVTAEEYAAAREPSPDEAAARLPGPGAPAGPDDTAA